MADDARTQFVDGLRVTAEHLQHLQDSLREGVHGTLAISDTLVWLSSDVTSAEKVLRAGGRLLIRLHCWNLFDADNRMFSAAPDALLPNIKSVHLPGGVLESWLFLQG